jgi:hypothetical protein
MIVIATNNGHVYLEKTLSKLSELGNKIPISIIDTNSTDNQTINFISDIDNGLYPNLNISTHQTPYRGFDTGAYIYAMKYIYSDKYYFIHDSFLIKTLDFIDSIDDLLKEGTVISTLDFDSGIYDNNEQIEFCLEKVGTSQYERGIFGPMFSILRCDVDKIIKSLNFYPTTKNFQMAMERAWPIIFKTNNINVVSLCGSLDMNKMQSDGYKFFTKFLPHRDYK